MSDNDKRFIGLLNIDDTARFGESDDSACFDDISKVFWKHEACNRFAVTLLHTHFSVRVYENLMEFSDLPNRKIVIQPVSASSCAELGGVPCSWRFTPRDTLPDSSVALQWAQCSTFAEADLAKWQNSDLDFMQDVVAVLARFGKLNRFGICLAKTGLKLEKEECLLETTHTSRRELHLEPAKVDSKGFERNVQTSWMIRSIEEFGTAGQCQQYCRTTCSQSSRGHDDKHKGRKHRK